MDFFASLQLFIAIEQGNINLVNKLVNPDNVNIKNLSGLTLLSVAIKCQHSDIAVLLIEKGANVNIRSNMGFLPLHLAALMGEIDIIDHLVERGADINATSDNGSTALHWAAYQNQGAAIEKLIEKGANKSVISHQNDSPVHTAAQKGCSAAIAKLVDNGFNVNASGNLGGKPLHFAVEQNHIDTVSMLIKKGANVNAVSDDGTTSLHLAARKGYLEIVEKLIETGSDVNAIDLMEHTPVLKAIIGQQSKIVVLLVASGASIDLSNSFVKAYLYDKETDLFEDSTLQNQMLSGISIFYSAQQFSGEKEDVKEARDYASIVSEFIENKIVGLASKFTRQDIKDVCNLKSILIELRKVSPLEGLDLAKIKLIDPQLKFYNRLQDIEEVKKALYVHRFDLLSRKLLSSFNLKDELIESKLKHSNFEYDLSAAVKVLSDMVMLGKILKFCSIKDEINIFLTCNDCVLEDVADYSVDKVGAESNLIKEV